MNVDPTGMFSIAKLCISLAIIGLIASLAFFPNTWGRMGSYGINQATTPMSIAIVDGKLGGIHEYIYSWSGFTIGEYTRELAASGHHVTYSVLPDEQEFINILNSNSYVIVVGHGIDIFDNVAPGDLLDNRDKDFAGVVLGGTSTHRNDDPIKDSTTDYTIRPNENWITANELDGRITNSQLELIGICCRLGKTKRIQEAISPGVFVGSRVDLRGRQARDLLDYATDRINGDDRNTAFNSVQSQGSHYVLYP
jgi:hypothetical protein